MKKNTVKVMLLLALSLGGGVSLFAQTPENMKRIAAHYDQDALIQLAAQFDKEHKANKAKAYQMAVEKGWEIKFTDKNGAENELMGVTEDERPVYAKTLNQGSVHTAGVDQINSGGSMGLTLNGQDMTVGLWDQNHPRVSHVTYNGRTTIMDGSVVDESLHPTHVLGTMIGNGTGNTAAKGFAYQGLGWLNSWDNDINEMTLEATQGLLVSNHSYTYAPSPIPEYFFGAYTNYARNLDNIVYNTGYYQPVIAAGNDRGDDLNESKNGKDLIYCYGTAKNAIVVAAVYEVENYVNANSVQMSSFSSWGPTDDFRIKPDISAKGVAVLSSSNTSNTAYTELQGTSMAAPAVSGCVLLMQQHYGNLHNFEYMKSATVRALVAHTAKEAGPAAGPDHMFGWGLINAAGAVQVISNQNTASILDELSLTSGNTYTRTVHATGNEPLKVTISWTDRQGTATSSAVDLVTPRLINDLDVRVFKDGVEYFPWALTKSFDNPAAVQVDNDADNIEKIEINSPESAYYDIVVTHKNTLTGGSQEYSMVVTGVDELAASENFETASFEVWPNPANNNLNINIPAALEGAEMTMYDLQGRQVAKNVLTVENNVLDVQSMSSGVYFVKVTKGTQTQTKKVVIE
jgi:serine protease AprX